MADQNPNQNPQQGQKPADKSAEQKRQEEQRRQQDQRQKDQNAMASVFPDRVIGLIADPVCWNDQIVNYVKDVGHGDAGFNAHEQRVVITLPSGEEKVVPKAEILTDERLQARPRQVPNRLKGPMTYQSHPKQTREWTEGAARNQAPR